MWYSEGMTLKLNEELSAALDATGDTSLEVVNPSNNRTYFLVDGETHCQAMDALRRQQDRDAIAEGIAQMEAGDAIPLEEAREMTRQHLLSRRQ
jgi:predicted transcriptional regulator